MEGEGTPSSLDRCPILVDGGEHIEPGPDSDPFSRIGGGLLGNVEGRPESGVPNHHSSTPLTVCDSPAFQLDVAGGPLAVRSGSDPHGTSGEHTPLHERVEEPDVSDPCGGVPPKEPHGITLVPPGELLGMMFTEGRKFREGPSVNIIPKQHGTNRTCGGGFTSEELVLIACWSGRWGGGLNPESYHKSRGFRTFRGVRLSRSL